MAGEINEKVRKSVRRMLFESYESKQFVIMNNEPEISVVEPPKIFFNLSNGTFVSDLRNATIFNDKGSVSQEIDNVRLKFPDLNLGVFTTELAEVYWIAFQKMYNKYNQNKRN